MDIRRTPTSGHFNFFRRSTVDKGSEIFNAGAVDITLEYRELMPDQGLCVQVFGEVDGQDVEILRFDCFRTRCPITTMAPPTTTSG